MTGDARFSTSLLIALLFAGGFLLTACGGSEEQQSCTSTAECTGDKVCGADGFCRTVSTSSCQNEADCPGGFICDDNTCVRPPDNQAENQTNQNQTNQNQTNQNQDPNQNQNQDPNQNQNQNQNQQPVDPNRPQVETFYPSQGSTDVDPDVVIRVIFDRPINPFSVSANSLYLQSPEGHRFPATLEYLADEREVVLTPAAPLWAGSSFTTRVRSFITDEFSTFAAVEAQATFRTSHEYEADLMAAVHAYAPVIYQEMRATQTGPGLASDIPTRVDFDGDMNAGNNKANASAQSLQLPATVYFSPVATETHYFIHYILYYPMRRSTSGEETTFYEHDFSGMLAVVERATGQLVLAEGVRLGESSSSDTTITYRPSGSAVQGRTDFHRNRIRNFNNTQLLDGTRFPLYVPSGVHAGCSWYERGLSWGPTACPDAPEAFVGGEGMVLRPGEVGQTYGDAEAGPSGHPEITYELVPFAEPFWTHRGDLNCGLFSSFGFTYAPWETAENPATTGPDDISLFLPRSLCATEGATYGVTPFTWFGDGEWLLDPARELNSRMNFNTEFSQDYCENLFFNIARRETAACGGGND